MAESGAKKAARGMLIGMKETRMGVEWGRGNAACAQPGCLVTLRILGIGLGSTLVEGWSSRTIDAGSSAAVVGVEVANLSSTVSTSTSVEIERGYRVQFAV